VAYRWEPEGPLLGPQGRMLGSKRYSEERALGRPAGRRAMGLIYVNPEGPDGKPRILLKGRPMTVRDNLWPDGNEH